MSHKLISLNPDLKKLRDEGYEIEIINAHLLVRSVPYVNSKKEVALGVLVTPLGDLAGDHTSKPQDHVIHFIGEHPCDKDGNILKGIQNASVKKVLTEGVEIDHSFSNKPVEGFSDYYEKVLNYVRIITAEAQYINPNITAKTFKVVESNSPEIVFHYIDTNSSRAEIDTITAKLQNLKIAIVGLGGTGSYILDLVSKTPVKEIHIFDKDDFLSHNAFRAPGAASIEDLNKKPKKVTYLQNIYSKIHKHVIPHAYHITTVEQEELVGMDFVFICLDNGEDKKVIINKLKEKSIPFIDVGIGISAIDGSLFGSARVTAVNVEKNNHISARIPFSEDVNNDYTKNIQTAEINALNASLAVIKWKKMFGFYHDQQHEFNSVYDITGNIIYNDETIS